MNHVMIFLTSVSTALAQTPAELDRHGIIHEFMFPGRQFMVKGLEENGVFTGQEIRDWPSDGTPAPSWATVDSYRADYLKWKARRDKQSEVHRAYVELIELQALNGQDPVLYPTALLTEKRAEISTAKAALALLPVNTHKPGDPIPK